MKRLVAFVLTWLTALALFSGSAGAATTTGTLDVSADVVGVCTVASTAVNFTGYDGSTVAYANGGLTVNCPDGTAYQVALDAGGNYDGANRRLSGGSGSISYLLYQNSSLATSWGDAGYGDTYPAGVVLNATGTGNDQPHAVYGVLSASTAPPGTYTDVVNVTVHY